MNVPLIDSNRQVLKDVPEEIDHVKLDKRGGNRVLLSVSQVRNGVETPAVLIPDYSEEGFALRIRYSEQQEECGGTGSFREFEPGYLTQAGLKNLHRHVCEERCDIAFKLSDEKKEVDKQFAGGGRKIDIAGSTQPTRWTNLK